MHAKITTAFGFGILTILSLSLTSSAAELTIYPNAATQAGNAAAEVETAQANAVILSDAKDPSSASAQRQAAAQTNIQPGNAQAQIEDCQMETAECPVTGMFKGAEKKDYYLGKSGTKNISKYGILQDKALNLDGRLAPSQGGAASEVLLPQLTPLADSTHALGRSITDLGAHSWELVSYPWNDYRKIKYEKPKVPATEWKYRNT